MLLALLLSSTAQAFCGFYVSGADASLYNDATMVVMMREGTRTVLSIQNNYQGPPTDFALVVPVPEVLQKENVKTLPDSVFGRVDSLAAPRLVEYWERDPCAPVYPIEELASLGYAEGAAPTGGATKNGDHGVTVEAQFEVGEYEIVILSARHSGGLDSWLRENRYNIPAGAEPVLRPYVEQGTKFFVAKVNPEKVKFEDDRAVLSPLRMHYDSQEFSLPVRLGLLNSKGQQDLLVHILARGQRYEVANYDNAFIPTNIRVMDPVRNDFGGFYEKLFRQTIEGRPKTVVTEYSWDASTCDPCPAPALDPGELATLGADLMQDGNAWGLVLTRLHYRYGKNDLDEDLVFKAAPPVIGGRGTPDAQGNMERGAQPSGQNMFQGRYAILHPWDGPVACDTPNRGDWTGPPQHNAPTTQSAASGLQPPRQSEISLVSVVVPEDRALLGLKDAPTPAPAPPAPALEVDDLKEERDCSTSPGRAGFVGALLGLLLAGARRQQG